MAKKNVITEESRLNSIEAELREIEKKYNCELGCWLSWRDLIHNLRVMENTPGFDEAKFKIDVKLI